MIDAHNRRHRDRIVLRVINPHGLGARRARLVMVQRFHLTGWRLALHRPVSRQERSKRREIVPVELWAVDL